MHDDAHNDRLRIQRQIIKWTNRQNEFTSKKYRQLFIVIV